MRFGKMPCSNHDSICQLTYCDSFLNFFWCPKKDFKFFRFIRGDLNRLEIFCNKDETRFFNKTIAWFKRSYLLKKTWRKLRFFLQFCKSCFKRSLSFLYTTCWNLNAFSFK